MGKPGNGKHCSTSKIFLGSHGRRFTFPAPEIVILLHQNILKWLHATPEISGATDKFSTKAEKQNFVSATMFAEVGKMANIVLQQCFLVLPTPYKDGLSVVNKLSASYALTT